MTLTAVHLLYTVTADGLLINLVIMSDLLFKTLSAPAADDDDDDKLITSYQVQGCQPLCSFI